MLNPSLQPPSKIAPEQRGPTPARVQPPSGRRVWTPLERILFRFVSIHVVVYFFPVPEDFLPGASWLVAVWAKIFLRAVPWVCRTALDVSCVAPAAAYANGDTAADYAALLLVAVTTIVITTIWSIADRRATAYPRLY